MNLELSILDKKYYMWSKPSTMSLSDDVLCVNDEHNRVKYRILKIGSHHFDGLKEMIRDQLAEGCYGAEPIAMLLVGKCITI